VLPISSYPLLTSPASIDFWLSEDEARDDSRKLVVVEDAESLLTPRGPDNSESLSNLLNAADGLLGDYLKVHIVATVNAPVDALDPAVIRPGRLLATRHFRRLTPAEAQRIAKLRGIKLPPQESYSLAEIYRQGNATTRKLINQPIGFAT